MGGAGGGRLNLITKLSRNFPCNMACLGKHGKEGKFLICDKFLNKSMITRKFITKRYQKTKITYAQQSWSMNIYVTKLFNSTSQKTQHFFLILFFSM